MIEDQEDKDAPRARGSCPETGTRRDLGRAGAGMDLGKHSRLCRIELVYLAGALWLLSCTCLQQTVWTREVWSLVLCTDEA